MTTTKKTRGKWRRRALISVGVVAVGVPGLWVAIHEVPGLGPALADGTRAVLGTKAVAWAEDVSYDLQDRFDRWRYKDAKPKTFWDAPPASAAPVAPPVIPVTVAAGSGTPAAPPPPEAFPPPAFAPPVPAVASEGDGTWIAVKDNTPAGQTSA